MPLSSMVLVLRRMYIKPFRSKVEPINCHVDNISSKDTTNILTLLEIFEG
jgi:hypothetical protein